MADQWDSLLDRYAPGQQKDPWDAALDQFDPNPPTPPKQNRGLAGDLVTDLKRGVQQIPGAVTGLMDIPVGLVFGERRVGKAFEKVGEVTGFQPGKWADEARAEYSAGRQQANQEVDQAWERGVGSGMAATLTNPGRLAGMVVESTPGMLAGGVVGRGAMAAGRGLGLVANPANATQRLAQGVVAGGVGEGAMIAGQMSDNLGDDVGGREGAVASLGAGVVGGFLGIKGGQLAQRMGVVDPETAIASGMRTAAEGVENGVQRGLLSRVGRGALAEGVFEEMPQSVQEQMWQNWAEDDPVFQGVARAGFEGALAGGLMGGAFNIPGKSRAETQPPANNGTPERTLALPAPGNSSYVETGTPNDLLLAADTERANEVAQAQANTNALYAARDEFEAERANAMANPAQSTLPGMSAPLFTETTEPRPVQDLLAEYRELRTQALAPEVQQRPELGQQLAERAKQLRQELGAQGVPWQVVDPVVMEKRINTLETEIRKGLDQYKNVLLSDPGKAPKLAERIQGMQNELNQFEPFLEQASAQGSFDFGDATAAKAPKVSTNATTDLLGGNNGSRNRVAQNAGVAQNSGAVPGAQPVGSAGNLAPVPAVGSGGSVDAGASVPGATASAPAGVSSVANTSLTEGVNAPAPTQTATPTETSAVETGAPEPVDRVTAFKQSSGVKRTDKRIGQFLQELDTARDSGQITQEEHAEYEQKLADAWKQKNKAAVTAHNAVAKDYATKVQERAKPANVHQVATQSVPDEQRFVQNLLGSLSPQERRVLELYHFDKQTMEDIGDTLSNEEGREKAYTRARIQQLHAAAVGKIKQAATQLGVSPERIDAYFGSENNSLQGGADVQTVSAAELAQSGAAMHTPGAATNPAQQGDDVPVADVAGNQELGEEAGLVGEFGDSDQFDAEPGERQFSREEAGADDGTYELTVEEVDAMEVIDSFNLQTTPSGDKITAQDVEATKVWWDDMDGTVLNDRFLPAMVNIYVALDTGRINDREFGAHYAEISKLNAKAGGPVQTTDGTDRQVSVEQDAGVQSQSGEGAAVRGTEDARESPEPTNPIERRVADLLFQLGERQAAAVSKIVRRFRAGEISLERLSDELQNYEDQVSEGVKFSVAAARDRLQTELDRWKGVIADFLAQRLERNKTHVLLTSTPASMQAMGLPNQEVRIGVHALDYVNTRLTQQQLEDLPNQLANPQMVYIHEGDKGLSINFVTDQKNGAGQLVIAMKPNHYTREAPASHFVATVVNIPQARIIGEFRKGHGMYVESKDLWPGLRDALNTAQKQNGRKASEVRELLSRTYNLTSVTKRLLFKSDLVNLIGSGRAQYSTTDKPQGTTERDIRAQLQGLFHSKSRFDAKVTVFSTADEVPVELRDQAAMDASVDAEDVVWDGVQGFAMNGKVYLIAENIAPGRELAVFLHEVGVHLGMKNLLGQDNYDKLVEQIKTWAESRKDTQEAQLARKALYRIMDAEEAMGEDMSQPDFDDELIAYFVEEVVLAGINPQALAKVRGPIAQWFRTLWASVKAALRKFGLDRVDTLTAQNLVDLAYGAADLALEGESIEVGGQSTKFSIARPQLPTFAEATDRVNDLLIGAKDGLDKLKLGFLTLEQLSWQSKSDKVKAYVSTMTKIQERSQGIVELASKIDQKWAGLSDKDSDALSKLMLASTKAGYDPSVEGAKPEGAEQTMIQQVFNDLKRRNTDAAELYSEVRDFYQDRYKQRLAILMDAANKAKLNGRDLEKIKEMYSKVPQPYFPMMRIGNYYAVGMSPRLAALEAKHKDGTITQGELAERGRLRKQEQHYIASSYDTLAEAQRAVRGYQQAGMTAYANEAKEQLTQAAVKLPGFAQMEAYMKAEVPDAELRDQLTGLFTKMVLEMTPENSAMKSMLKREGIAGAHQDMRQVFAKSAITQAHYISRLEYNHQLMGDLATVHKEGEGANIGGTRIYNELVARTKLATEMEDHPIVDKLMNASYLAHLGASPAYWLLNATQVPMITFPWLGARFGFGRSGTALATAFNDARSILKTTLSEKAGWRSDIDWSKRFGKDSNEHKLLEEMNRRNLLSITMEHDLGATARMGGSKYGLGSFAKLVNTPVRLIEYANRATTALAAYRLEMAKSGNHDEAVEVAAKAVSMTQLNYSGLNTPRHMQSVLGSKTLARMMMQFRKFQQGMLYLTVSSINDAIRATGKDAAETKQLRLEARKTLLGLFATTGVMAGTLGTPMFATVAALANAIANAGGDDDEPWDFETELRNFYADVLGKDVGLAFAKGLPAAFGVDLSKRVGMGDIGSPLPFVRAGENVQATAGNIALGLGGAPVGMMVGIADGMSQVAGGDVLKGAEKITPLKLVKDIGKAIRYSDEGMTDRNGNVILPNDRFDPWDLTLRAMGLGTTKESEYYDANNAVQTAKDAATGTRNKLLRKYAEARLANEPLGDIQAEIAEFNQRHPQKGVRIDASSMLRSVQNRRNMAKERDGSGVRAGKANAPYLDNARFAVGT